MRIDPDGQNDVRVRRRINLNCRQQVEAAEDTARGCTMDTGGEVTARDGEVVALAASQLRAEEVKGVDGQELRGPRLLRALLDRERRKL